ncbi:hypothetical protein [Pseudomonas nitroreducens]|uniref:hypothetical protein n=1 Tax=Pseudomonas nitroreducens TaxID=46680 RepID=UPI0026596867|nr:hypothetical protein [Pseudomonas nitroreducens]MCP1652257.1 hypothetical protein [Pseudomonas nitroreducens]MCP1689767.1 hypothetical protein [Pseudomonas nitroreducens]
MKFRPANLPAWAWTAALASSLFLPCAMLWFLVDQVLRTSAVVQLMAKASGAGLFAQPGVLELAKGAVAGGSSLKALCVGVFLTAVLHSLLLLAAPFPWRKTEQ